jgi:hypothetical protein
MGEEERIYTTKTQRNKQGNKQGNKGGDFKPARRFF